MSPTNHRIAGDIQLTVRRPSTQRFRSPIVLCHGFCGIQEILLPAFADAFVAAGFVAVTFDYRGFGASGGERGRLVPAMQIDDIRGVVSWARRELDVGDAPAGLWGTSLGGCHAVVAAADDPGIGCVVAQMPFADGETLITGAMSVDEKAGLLATLDKMEQRRRDDGREMMVPVTRVLGDPESKAFFEHSKAAFPAIDVKIPFLTVLETLRYRPADAAPRVSCPTLVLLAEQDAVNPPQQGRALFDALGTAKKSLHIEPDAHHYDLYDGAHFASVSALALDWFSAHLLQIYA